MPLRRPQLHIHMLGQPTAGQQQACPCVVTQLLAALATQTHARGGVPPLQWNGQPGSGKVDARQRHLLALW